MSDSRWTQINKTNIVHDDLSMKPLSDPKGRFADVVNKQHESFLHKDKWGGSPLGIDSSRVNDAVKVVARLDRIGPSRQVLYFRTLEGIEIQALASVLGWAPVPTEPAWWSENAMTIKAAFVSKVADCTAFSRDDSMTSTSDDLIGREFTLALEDGVVVAATPLMSPFVDLGTGVRSVYGQP